MKLYLLFEALCFLLISLCFWLRINKMEISLKNSLIIVFILFSMILYLFIRLINKNYRKCKEPYKYNELFNYIDITNTDEDEDLENKLIYPDDYPFQSETFLGRYLPFLQFKENKIRRKLKQYVTLSMKKNYEI